MVTRRQFYSPQYVVLVGMDWKVNSAYTLIRNMEIYHKTDKAKGFIDFYEMGDRDNPINTEVSTGLSLKVGLSYRIVPGKK